MRRFFDALGNFQQLSIKPKKRGRIFAGAGVAFGCAEADPSGMGARGCDRGPMGQTVLKFLKLIAQSEHNLRQLTAHLVPYRSRKIREAPRGLDKAIAGNHLFFIVARDCGPQPFDGQSIHGDP